MNEPESKPIASPTLEDLVEWTWEVPLVVLRKTKDGTWVAVASWNAIEKDAWRTVRDAITRLAWNARRNPSEWVR